ncbi:MAG: FAD-dependent thymidylate synthase [Devosia sp.]|nr:FAD-dependent thymidylate synthase [Devosia sp.]
MTTISAKTILRSRNAAAPGKVLSTLLVRMPRIILAEWNTHRVFSRNAASTRAIPTERLIQQVVDDPFIPTVWGRNQKGMQAGDNVADIASCEREWLLGRDRAVETARSLLNLGLHKQVAGRVLEPWMFTLVCVSSTEWANFLELRDHADAEPHIAMLAREVRKCLEDESTIQTLQPGEWHLPFVEEADLMSLLQGVGPNVELALDRAKKLSVARCASTSYRTTDGFGMTLERAVSIFEKLSSTPLHASPFEHIAVADGFDRGRWSAPAEHRNFVGFRQYRASVEQVSAR